MLVPLPVCAVASSFSELCPATLPISLHRRGGLHHECLKPVAPLQQFPASMSSVRVRVCPERLPDVAESCFLFTPSLGCLLVHKSTGCVRTLRPKASRVDLW